MYSGYQEREEYEDELYGQDDEEVSSLSEADSELEFRLYSQLHYADDVQNKLEVLQSPLRDEPRERFSQAEPKPQPPIFVVDSGPDVITISDDTEDEEDSVCAQKYESSQKKKSGPSLPPCRSPATPKYIREKVVVVDSESDPSSESDSIAAYVEDPFLDDSDSDGLENWMILGQGKEDGDQNIQLNLSEDLEQDFLVDEGSQSGVDWSVSTKDKEAQIFNKTPGSRRVSARYYTEKSVTCHNCSRLGHLSKNCPIAKKPACCSLCGMQGHLMRTCPNRHCSNCSLPGHTYDDCLERPYWHKRCNRCHMTGHFYDACPEIWRQYHITTRGGLPLKPEHPLDPRSPAYCYNCSRQGHFGHECKEKRMFNGTYPTLPFVFYYETKKDLKYRELRAEKQARELQTAGLLVVNVSLPTPQPPRKKQKRDPRHAPLPPTPAAKPPKKRVAHTPKPRPTPQTRSPALFTPPQPEAQKKKRNRKKNKKSENADFIRNLQQSPASGGVKRSPAMLFGQRNVPERSNKKKNKIKKWAKKALRDEAPDENLFLIKQRKRSR